MKTTSLEKVRHNLVSAINVNMGNTGGLLPSQGPTERSHRLCFPGRRALTSLFHSSPCRHSRHSEGSREYHAHGALGHAGATCRMEAEVKLRLRQHSRYFPVCCAWGTTISSMAPSTRKGPGPQCLLGPHLFCSLLMGIFRGCSAQLLSSGDILNFQNTQVWR